ncbi:seipin [Sporobolomyces salmoneus]|uniref:seipin n=1 Tax=Sporobolomyces salmoneus TaxID=183962 RepID=UPI00316CBEBB
MSPSSSTSASRKPSSSTSDSVLPQYTSSPVESLASLLIRSLLVFFLLLTSLLLALVAWFSLRSFLKVDPIIGSERVWLQYGEFRTPYAFVDLPTGKYTAPGESYDISIELKVPSSQQNLVMGNFMTTISLLNQDTDPILRNSRPAILSHPVHPKLSHVLPLLRPIPPPVQNLNLPLLESVALNRNGWQGSSKRVEKVYVEVGRKDAHPEWLNQDRNTGLGGETTQDSVIGRGAMVPARLGGELQVYESWLKIEGKLYGLRSLIRSHPYLSFLFFFPTFLLTELLAALAVYAYFVVRPTTTEEEEATSRLKQRLGGESTEELESEDAIEQVLEREIKAETPEEEDEEELLTSEPPLGTTETETEETGARGEARWESERRSERREREAGPGGKGMSEIAGETETETETETEIETGVSSEEGEGSEGWAAIEGEGTVRVEKDFDETATVGGSETTRATRSTFGPSVAGTTSTRTTATSSRPSEGLRERQGRLAEEKE